MKKNKVFFLGLITVFVAVLSLTLVSGTWAKYTSSTEASATARVAKWEWTAKTADADTEFKFNLFDTILDTADGNADTDVKTETDTTKNPIIAPGTKGETTITVSNASEVNGKATATFTVTTANLPASTTMPITYKYKVGAAIEYTTATPDASGVFTIDLGNVAMNANTTITLAWEWAFENTTDTTVDSNDTALGTAATAPTVTVTAKLVFTQVD